MNKEDSFKLSSDETMYFFHIDSPKGGSFPKRPPVEPHGKARLLQAALPRAVLFPCQIVPDMASARQEERGEQHVLFPALFKALKHHGKVRHIRLLQHADMYGKPLFICTLLQQRVGRIVPVRRTVAEEHHLLSCLRCKTGKDRGQTVRNIIVFRTVCAKEHRLADLEHVEARRERFRFLENLVFVFAL